MIMTANIKRETFFQAVLTTTTYEVFSPKHIGPKCTQASPSESCP